MCTGQARTRLESCWGLAECLRQDHIEGLEEEPQQARWWLINHGGSQRNHQGGDARMGLRSEGKAGIASTDGLLQTMASA